MAQITKRITSNLLGGYPIIDGQTIFVTDKNLLYQDIGNRRYAIVPAKKLERIVSQTGNQDLKLISNQLLLDRLENNSYSLSFIDDIGERHILSSGEEFDPSVFDKKLYIRYFDKNGDKQTGGYTDSGTVYAGFALSLNEPVDDNEYEKINLNPDIDAGGW